MASNYAETEQPIAGTSEGGQAPSGDGETIWHPVHWITRDPDHLQCLDNNENIQLYNIAYDEEHTNEYGHTTPGHYHVFFGYRDGVEKKKIFRGLRRKFGCKPSQATSEEEKARFEKCKQGNSGDWCPNCGFHIKTTKPIKTQAHIRNVWQYISRKEGSINHPQYDLGEPDSEDEALQDYFDDNYSDQESYESD